MHCTCRVCYGMHAQCTFWLSASWSYSPLLKLDHVAVEETFDHEITGFRTLISFLYLGITGCDHLFVLGAFLSIPLFLSLKMHPHNIINWKRNSLNKFPTLLVRHRSGFPIHSWKSPYNVLLSEFSLQWRKFHAHANFFLLTQHGPW